jgi:NAD(P)-dependent dehydrogenase (short-subunit alcohol dehydrogenase family)
MTKQVVFITGASRGFGAAAARKIAERGHTVIATMRSPQRDGPAVRAGLEERIEVAELDVTDVDGVEAVVAATLERHGRIDVLINNAGYGIFGPSECGTEAQLWRQLDTNTFGPWRLVKAVLPSMRARRSGKIANVTSLSGRIVSPMLGHYAATKYALEALSEGLRFEVGALGIQVCIVEPGMYASDWQTGNLDLAENVDPDAYGDLMQTRLEGFRALAATRPGSASVAAGLADIVDLQQPLPMRWPIGNDAARQIPLRTSLLDEEWEQLRRSGALGPWRVPLHPDPPELTLPKRFATRWLDAHVPPGWTNEDLSRLERELHEWTVTPAALEGFDKAEVTFGSTHRSSSTRRDRHRRSQRGRQRVRYSVWRIDARNQAARLRLVGCRKISSEAEMRRQFDTNFIGQWRLVETRSPVQHEPSAAGDRERLVVGASAEARCCRRIRRRSTQWRR